MVKSSDPGKKIPEGARDGQNKPKVEHAALPLTNEGFDIFDKDGIIFCHVSGDSDQQVVANAAFIVKAVNGHYQNLKTIEELIFHINDLIEQINQFPTRTAINMTYVKQVLARVSRFTKT